MTRSVTTAVNSALIASNVPALLLVDLDFSSGHVRVNNSAVNFSWNGYTWLGLANLGGIEAIHENTALEMSGVKMTLSGIPSEMITHALAEYYQGRSCDIWFSPLDSNLVVLADPVKIFNGRIDTMSIQLGSTCSISLTAESRLTDWERPRVRRYTHEDQITEFPADRGLEYVSQMVEKTLSWGKT